LEAKGKEKTAAGVRSVVKVHLVEADPELSEKPARQVTPHDIAGLIRRITEKGKGRTAGIFRSSLAAAYSCGRKAPFDGTLPKAFIDFNIETNPVDLIPTIPVKARNRTLNRTELKSYIESLGDNTVDLALKLALYAGGQRMAQLLRAEVTDWTPETRTLRLMDPKGKRSEPREHLLPLATVAVSIVDELIKRAEQAKTIFLFPSNTLRTPLHVSTPGPRVTEIAGTIDGESFDLRDIRRTCETMLAELGIRRDIRAQLLSHGISGVQAVHYDRYAYTKEKRAALVRWERYLKQVTSGTEEKKIIPITEAKGGR
jgi:integrase